MWPEGFLLYNKQCHKLNTNIRHVERASVVTSGDQLRQCSRYILVWPKLLPDEQCSLLRNVVFRKKFQVPYLRTVQKCAQYFPCKPMQLQRQTNRDCSCGSSATTHVFKLKKKGNTEKEEKSLEICCVVYGNAEVDISKIRCRAQGVHCWY